MYTFLWNVGFQNSLKQRLIIVTDFQLALGYVIRKMQ